MSGNLFYLGTAGNATVLGMNTGTNWDEIQPAEYRRSPPYSIVLDIDRHSDVVWPRSNFPGMISDGGNSGPYDPACQNWEWPWTSGGVSRDKIISGFTRDKNGNAIGGVTVWLFNTATGLLVDSDVSAVDGSFSMGDPNNVNCFLVGYLAGSPDTSGVTVDTLTGV